MQLQRTEIWLLSRLGKVGASRIADLMAKTRTGYGASRANLMAELICERLTGVPTNGYMNAAMVWGIDQEASAKAAYSFMADREIEEVGFIDHHSIVMAGCSPDGLLGDDGLIEIKCPNSATHIETLMTGVIDDKYIKQVQFQMAVTGREWAEFVSYDPRLPPEMQLWTKKVPRDDRMIVAIEIEVRTFLDELDTKIATLRSRYMEKAA